MVGDDPFRETADYEIRLSKMWRVLDAFPEALSYQHLIPVIPLRPVLINEQISSELRRVKCSTPVAMAASMWWAVGSMSCCRVALLCSRIFGMAVPSDTHDHQ